VPELQYFTVTQEREVKVAATSPINAAALADRVFSGTTNPEDKINVISPVRECNMLVRKDY
jgi:hypothetical protein